MPSSWEAHAVQFFGDLSCSDHVGDVDPDRRRRGAASGCHLRCRLSTNPYLPADPSCPADPGLTLTGNITLDLKNHKLIGTGNKQGIALSVQTPSTPQIKNGAIQEWNSGITSFPTTREAPPERHRSAE